MKTLRLGKLTQFMAGWGGAGLLVLFALAILCPAPAEAGAKKYYLTQGQFEGNQALTACDPGFHMASFWEVRDTSNLDYDSTRGFTQADSGDGPPSDTGGWIRTGQAAGTSPVAGQANCAAWASNNGADSGTTVRLSNTWTAACSVISPWVAFTADCDDNRRVWCIHN